MPPLLHDPAVRDAILARIRTLRPDTPRKWGTMTVDQMLHHLNAGFANALDELRPTPMKLPLPLPLPVFKWVVFNIPWPKGAPTAPEYVAGDRYDFAEERAACLAFIGRIASRGVDASGWGRSPGMGALTGREWSRLTAKHVLHHLRQFGV